MTAKPAEVIEYTTAKLEDSLDGMETRTRMYASTPEALEAQYLQALRTLLLLRGEDPGRLVVSTYQRITRTEEQNCTPIWNRDGYKDTITLDDIAAFLKKTRAEVLG